MLSAPRQALAPRSPRAGRGAQQGLSLLEMLISVAIATVLATGAWHAKHTLRQQADLRILHSVAHSLQLAQASHWARTGRFASSTAMLGLPPQALQGISLHWPQTADTPSPDRGYWMQLRGPGTQLQWPTGCHTFQIWYLRPQIRWDGDQLGRPAPSQCRWPS